MSTNILIGVTGGIAAYKSCELIRLFHRSGCNVKVVMTENAKKFVTTLTFSALTSGQVYDDLFSNEDPMIHIILAKWADMLVIAPTTASFLNKIASGAADDLLTTICLATEVKCYIAPAMNKIMWEKPATQENIKKIKSYGYNIIVPNCGDQACGDVGPGRMAEPAEIFNLINQQDRLFSGVKMLITAGPTYEKIDPVRYIGNYSSGKMGYALASAAQNLGADVHLISGPVSINAPRNCKITYANTAEEMHNVVNKNIGLADIFISAAAVSDYTPQAFSMQKIKKDNEKFTLELVKTQDILKEVSMKNHSVFTVGFCAETEKVIGNAKTKLANKQLGAIVANKVNSDGYPFNDDKNTLCYLSAEKTLFFEQDLKMNLAKRLLKEIYTDFKNTQM